MIGRATGHLVALGVPGLDEVRVRGTQHPFLRRGDRIGGDLVDDPGALCFLGVDGFALQQVLRGPHHAQFAHQAGRATAAGKDADHDFRQADLGLGVVGGKDTVTGERQFQSDAHGGAGQGGGNRLAALLGLGVHAGEFDLAQPAVQVHHAVEHRLDTVLLHLAENVEVHPAGKAVLAAGDDDPLDRLVAQGLVDQCIQFRAAREGQHVHRFAGQVPGDDRDAIGACFHREFSHVSSSPYTRSMMVAAPMPLATQSVARPVPRPRRSISSRSVPMMIAPDAPSG